MTNEEMYNTLKSEIQPVIGDLWERNKDAFQEWAKLLTSLYLSSESETKKLAYKYAEFGLAALRTRIQYQVEDKTWQIVEKVATILLKVGMTI